MNFVPKKCFLTGGVGFHKTELQSFEMALRAGGIEKLNLVYVSSILPPHCEIIDKEEGLSLLTPGQITFCVMARATTDEYNRLVGASVGMAIPNNKNNYGYISEHHGYGMDKKELGDFAEDLATTMLATTLGIDFDPDKGYDERKDIYFMDGQIIKSDSYPVVCNGLKNGFTTAVSSVIFLL